MSEVVEAVVVGAGVIGLAIARALALAGREVVVLEAETSFGNHSSSRNSEVIHAGIYYPPGSLKARLCLEGKHRMYRYCERHGISHRRVGKLIVATDESERGVLDRLAANARASGLHDLQRLDAHQTRELEPVLDVVDALWSPSTGVVDSHGLMSSLLADAESRGAMVAWSSPLRAGRVTGDGFVLDAGDTTLRCRLLVNAAGLEAQDVASRIDGLPPTTVPRRHLAKGSYFKLALRSPFSHLVYPIPASASLGIHLTLDLGGQARFGPDQEWVETIDYEVDPARAEAFYPAIRRYWPALPDGALQPDYAGIRAKVQAPGKPLADFVLQGPPDHGVPGLVNTYGIESPGLTACLAIADEGLRRLGVSTATGTGT